MVTKGALAAVAGACLLAALLLAPTAEAKRIRYSGKTSQGLKMVLMTNAKGRAQYAAIHFDARCTESREISNSVLKFVPKFKYADYRSFRDGGALLQQHYDDGTTGKVRAHILGKRLDRNRLEGTFRLRAAFFDGGEKFNSCRTGRIHWSAHR